MTIENIAISLIIVLIFFATDFYIRSMLKKSRAKRRLEHRTDALEKGLRIAAPQEVQSLKRIELDQAKARILCVDDDPVVLDSLRKILVLEGYSVDTVETGREALSLLQFHHYDFVVVDLKMPEMDGSTVTRNVKRMRPDIDVIILTGYATIDSAVDMMKLGVLDYVQKPFTSDELLALVEKCLKKRRDRIKETLEPKVYVASIEEFGKHKFSSFVIPGGVFISESHCWVSLMQDGTAQIGIDDFAKRIIGCIEQIEFPNLGMQVSKDQLLFGIRCTDNFIPFVSPLSGEVIKINNKLMQNPTALDETPYAQNWICCLHASAIESEISELKIGQTAVNFFRQEIENCKSQLKKIVHDKKKEELISEGNGSISGQIKQLDQKQRSLLIDKLLRRGTR